MSQQMKNPFLHQHDHDHHHHHHGEDDGELIEQLDPAQQSLADALRVSFFVLKIVMLALLVMYLLSGIFWVSEQENAVRLRFGALVGEPGEQVYSEGWYFGLPYPIEQVIRVPSTPQSVGITRAFMPENVESTDPLNPERDGSLMSGDANVVHGQFSVNYRIADPAAFVQSVDSMTLADELVRSAAEQGVLYAVARTDADTFIRGNVDMHLARTRAQGVLDSMRTGIELSTFVLNESRPPAAVAQAFEAVTRAESTRSSMIDAARQEQARILGEAAGEAALPMPDGSRAPLLSLILEYERAVQLGEEAEAENLDQLLDMAFRELVVPADPAAPEAATVAIGGEAAQAIQTARSYASGIVQRIRAEAETVSSLAQEYGDHQRLLYTRLWQDAREQIFTGDIETFYIPPGRPYLTTNRDPQVFEERERRRLQEEQGQPGQGRP